MQAWHKGQVLTIWLWTGCQESWDGAEALVPGSRAGCKAQFRARLALLADRGVLRCPDHMNPEGDGIFAVKSSCGLRAYGWHCSYDGRRAFVVSHVVMKKTQKADPAELRSAKSAKAAFEKSLGNQKKNMPRG